MKTHNRNGLSVFRPLIVRKDVEAVESLCLASITTDCYEMIEMFMKDLPSLTIVTNNWWHYLDKVLRTVSITTTNQPTRCR